MKTYHILLGNCEDLLNDFIEALFREVCGRKAGVKCTRVTQAGDLVRQACEENSISSSKFPATCFLRLGEPTP